MQIYLPVEKMSLPTCEENRCISKHLTIDRENLFNASRNAGFLGVRDNLPAYLTKDEKILCKAHYLEGALAAKRAN